MREAKRPMMCIMTTCGPGRVRGPPWPDAGAAGAGLGGLRHQGDEEERHDKDRGRPPASEHGADQRPAHRRHQREGAQNPEQSGAPPLLLRGTSTPAHANLLTTRMQRRRTARHPQGCRTPPATAPRFRGTTRALETHAYAWLLARASLRAAYPRHSASLNPPPLLSYATTCPCFVVGTYSFKPAASSV